MPCYNHQDYVHDAVASVLAQTLTDIEIIAIDDGSTDATAQVLREFDDSRLKLVRHNQSRGLAKTINEGIRRSKGTHIAILNSDDRYHPERLKYCQEIAETNDALFLGTDLELIADFSGAQPERTAAWLDGYNDLRERYLKSGDLIATLIAGNLFVTTSNFFCRRSLFDSIGPLADRPYVEDYDFLLRTIAAYPQQMHWLDHKLLFYRLQEDNFAPGRQTLEVLTHWIPHLAVGEQATERLHLFESHLLKLAEEIESDSVQEVHTQWQADVGSHQRVIRDKDDELNSLQTRMDAKLTAAREKMSSAQALASELESELSTIRSQLDASQSDLAGTRSNLASAQSDLARIRSEFAESKSALLASQDRGAASESNNKILMNRTDQLNEELEAHRDVIGSLRGSLSYRLGYRLLQPLRWIRQLARKIRE